MTTLRPLLAAALLTGLVAAPPALARDVHVDCAARTAGDGSTARPLDSVAAASAVPVGPGDRILLRRGTRCEGTLAPDGSGAPGAPVVVGAYGARGARPRIAATGAEAVLLDSRSHVVVQDLDLSAPGDGTAKKRGIHVVATDGVVSDVTIRRLRIHDVGGNLDKDSGGSGGIQASAYGAGARFAGLLIEDNVVRDVSRSGIFLVGSTDPNRPRAGEPWPLAATGVIVRRNVIDGIAGDGIVPLGTDGAIVEDNVVRNGNRAGRSPFDPAGMVCDAGIWPFHANGTIIQRNEVSGFGFNGCDGTAFDIDYDNDGTIVQRNFSHDNGGGFLLLCTEDAPRAADVRFNLSLRDGATLNESPCRLDQHGFGGTLDGIRIFNNTWVAERARIISPAGDQLELPVLAKAGTLEFANNIVVSTAQQLTPLPCGDHCSHNLFFGLPPSGTDAIVADPRFAEGYRLRPGSPAIGTGVRLAAPGTTDYFGTPLGGWEHPSRGMQQPPVTP